MVKALCCVRTEYQFKEKIRELDKVMNQAAKTWLHDQMEQKEKWALTYDEGGFGYGIMTTNSSKSFNRVFTGVRSLPVAGIVEFSFMKCNEYFVKRWELAHRNIREARVWGKVAAHFIKELHRLVHKIIFMYQLIWHKYVIAFMCTNTV
jgi:hypothetical protein